MKPVKTYIPHRSDKNEKTLKKKDSVSEKKNSPPKPIPKLDHGFGSRPIPKPNFGLTLIYGRNGIVP